MSMVAEVAEEGASLVAKASGVLSWLPWAAAAVSLVAGAGGTLWYRSQYLACAASVAIEAARAEEQVRAQKDADAKFTRQLADQLQSVKAAIQEQAHATSVALAKVQSVPACKDTPAARAFDAGVVPRPGQQAGAGAARPAGP
jgi:outer membrane receptor for monomeric catechols